MWPACFIDGGSVHGAARATGCWEVWTQLLAYFGAVPFCSRHFRLSPCSVLCRKNSCLGSLPTMDNKQNCCRRVLWAAGCGCSIVQVYPDYSGYTPTRQPTGASFSEGQCVEITTAQVSMYTMYLYMYLMWSYTFYFRFEWILSVLQTCTSVMCQDVPSKGSQLGFPAPCRCCCVLGTWDVKISTARCPKKAPGRWS